MVSEQTLSWWLSSCPESRMEQAKTLDELWYYYGGRKIGTSTTTVHSKKYHENIRDARTKNYTQCYIAWSVSSIFRTWKSGSQSDQQSGADQRELVDLLIKGILLPNSAITERACWTKEKRGLSSDPWAFIEMTSSNRTWAASIQVDYKEQHVSRTVLYVKIIRPTPTIGFNHPAEATFVRERPVM